MSGFIWMENLCFPQRVAIYFAPEINPSLFNATFSLCVRVCVCVWLLAQASRCFPARSNEIRGVSSVTLQVPAKNPQGAADSRAADSSLFRHEPSCRPQGCSWCPRCVRHGSHAEMKSLFNSSFALSVSGAWEWWCKVPSTSAASTTDLMFLHRGTLRYLLRPSGQQWHSFLPAVELSLQHAICN